MAPLGATIILAVIEVTLSDGGYASITPPILTNHINLSKHSSVPFEKNASRKDSQLLKRLGSLNCISDDRTDGNSDMTRCSVYSCAQRLLHFSPNLSRSFSVQE